MALPTARLARSDRLRLSKDFQRVARHGTRVASRDFVVLVASQSRDAEATRRLGVTASRKVGPAVVRNRIKRGIREWFRRYRGDLAEGVDVVVIARRTAAMLPGPDITTALRDLTIQVNERMARSQARGPGLAAESDRGRPAEGTNGA